MKQPKPFISLKELRDAVVIGDYNIENEDLNKDQAHLELGTEDCELAFDPYKRIFFPLDVKFWADEGSLYLTTKSHLYSCKKKKNEMF